MMGKGRLEAFSDGVIAIIITIMVLEIKVPHGTDWETLSKLVPVFFGYVLSFLYVGIYWNNHHHMFQAVKRVNGATLWANLHLLFWLSLLPFGSGLMTENHYAATAVMIYGANLLMCAVAYTILLVQLRSIHPIESVIHHASGADTQGKISVAGYIIGIVCALFGMPLLGVAAFCAVALMWLIPDRKIEQAMLSKSGGEEAE